MTVDVRGRLDDVLDGSVAVEHAFAVELAAARPDHRRVLVAALRSACGESHRRRLLAQGMDESAIRASVARTVGALLRA
jgi:hypothetical protein